LPTATPSKIRETARTTSPKRLREERKMNRQVRLNFATSVRFT
jgi:hypothetical protein